MFYLEKIKMGATKEQAEKTKLDLLDAALNVFSKKGYNSTRLEDIAQEASVTRGAFYWHFKNKTEVFCELHKQIMNNFIQSMRDFVEESLSPLNNLKNVLLKTMTMILEDKNAQQIGKLIYAFENTPELAPVLTTLRKEMEHPIQSFFTDLINKGKKSLEIRNDIETEYIFKASVINMKGTIFQIFNDISPINKTDIKSIVNIFIDGIKNRSNE